MRDQDAGKEEGAGDAEEGEEHVNKFLKRRNGQWLYGPDIDKDAEAQTGKE